MMSNIIGSFVVIMMKTNDYRTGYINATKLCREGGKRLHEWSKREENKQLITDFTNYLGGFKAPPKFMCENRIKRYE